MIIHGCREKWKNGPVVNEASRQITIIDLKRCDCEDVGQFTLIIEER